MLVVPRGTLCCRESLDVVWVIGISSMVELVSLSIVTQRVIKLKGGPSLEGVL